MFHKKSGFTFTEIIVALRIITIVLVPLPSMFKNIWNLQEKADSHDVKDIQYMMTDIKYDFALIGSESNIDDTNLPKTISFTRIDGCIINYSFDSTNNEFERSVITEPSGANCGRNLFIRDLKNNYVNTNIISKDNTLKTYTFYFQKDFDSSDVHKYYIKVRPIF